MVAVPPAALEFARVVAATYRVAAVGIGLHKFRDPGLTEQWSTVPLDIEVTDFHTYAVDWQPGSLVFTVDDGPVPEMIVSHVLGP